MLSTISSKPGPHERTECVFMRNAFKPCITTEGTLGTLLDACNGSYWVSYPLLLVFNHDHKLLVTHVCKFSCQVPVYSHQGMHSCTPQQPQSLEDRNDCTLHLSPHRDWKLRVRRKSTDNQTVLPTKVFILTNSNNLPSGCRSGEMICNP